jgi:hypothetical protein
MLTYLWYHSYVLLLTLTLGIVDLVVALYESLLLLQVCHQCSDVVQKLFVMHQQLMRPSLHKTPFSNLFFDGSWHLHL